MRQLLPSEKEQECPFCKQPPGKPCLKRKPMGVVAQTPHHVRINKWFEAGIKNGSIQCSTVKII